MYFVDDILYVLNYSDINMRYDIKAYSSVDDMKIIDLDKCPYDYNITVEKNSFLPIYKLSITAIIVT